MSGHQWINIGETLDRENVWYKCSHCEAVVFLDRKKPAPDPDERAHLFADETESMTCDEIVVAKVMAV